MGKIDRLLKKGYIKSGETEKHIYFKKDRKFSWRWFLLLCLTGIGGLFYIIYYFFKRTHKTKRIKKDVSN